MRAVSVQADANGHDLSFAFREAAITGAVTKKYSRCMIEKKAAGKGWDGQITRLGNIQGEGSLS